MNKQNQDNFGSIQEINLNDHDFREPSSNQVVFEYVDSMHSIKFLITLETQEIIDVTFSTKDESYKELIEEFCEIIYNKP